MIQYFLRGLAILILLIKVFPCQSQAPTIGLRFYTENVSPGYTLFAPEKNQAVYLINNCGEKINEWFFSEYPGATCYLLENGTLLRAGKDSLEIRDWNNNLLWSYPTTNNGLAQHHDIEPLPNGNILCVINDLYPAAEASAQGRDTSLLGANFKLDKIVELQPVGTNDANIVWEWKFMDHFVQELDSVKPNYGVVADHPELIDINFDNNLDVDWTHVNAVDYNASLDQIIISSRHLSEIYIIDHSTTLAEAAGHTGGNSNHGGDILWRWGNPQVYRQGGPTDQKLFGQHDPKWVEEGYSDAGKISVFNNGGDGTETFSSVHLLNPDFISGEYIKENNKFKPLDYDWSWNGLILGYVVIEDRKSGIFSLPNGNVLICQSSNGQLAEITKTGDLVWIYRNPVGETIYNQNDQITTSENSIFKAEKYQDDFPGFFGKDMTPQGIIEDQNNISATCFTSIIGSDHEFEEILITNPAENGIILFNNSVNLNAIIIKDITGKEVFRYGFFRGNILQTSLKPGLYFLILYSESRIATQKVIIK